MAVPLFYRFEYAIRNEKGDLVDSSAGGEALSFVEGDGTMIRGLSQALSGRTPGDEFQVTIGPDDAYGWPKQSLIRTVSADMFDTDVGSLEVGMIFQVGSGDSREVVKIANMSEDGITIDGNHPLAGITFHFDIKVIEARQASDEEIKFSKLGPGDLPPH